MRLPEELLGPEHLGSAGEWGPYMFAMPIPEFKELVLKWVETRPEDGGKRRVSRRRNTLVSRVEKSQA